MRDNVNLSAAVRAWRRAVGERNVILRQSELDAKATATYEARHIVTAIVRPGSREEVQQCVRIATRYRVPIYPISGGQNIGYGSAAPTHDCAIFDLARLDHIVLDRKQATVTVGPGVRSPVLAQYVAKHAPELIASLPVQTSPRSSAVGNALDGGIGFGLFPDRALSAFSIEAVVGTGEVMHTGMDRFKGGERLGRTEARLGPSFRDLFIQSNFGVVTSVTFGLFPMPGDLRRLTVALTSRDDAALFIERLRPLVRAGVIELPYTLNSEGGIAQTMLNFEYPWKFTGGRTPLPAAALSDLRRMGMQAWGGIIHLWSLDRGIGEAREKAVRRALGNLPVHTMVVRDRDIRGYILPDGSGLRALYWGKTRPAPSKVEDIDPHRDRCGFIWSDFSVHEDPKLMLRLVRDLEPLIRSYGFDPSMQIHTVWPRALFIIVSLTYDRDVPDADLRAERCEEAMAAFFAKHDVLPARRRVGTMHHIPPMIDDSAAVYDRVKKAFDPKGILSPGRYERRTGESGAPSHGKSAYDMIEREHLAIVDKLATTNHRKIRTKPGPLRACFVDARQLEAVRHAAELLLPAFVAAGRALLDRAECTRLLRIDERMAAALRHDLDRRPPSGRIEGVFDHYSGDYRVLGFDSGLERAEKGHAVEDILLSNLAVVAILSDSKQRPRMSKDMARAVDQHVPWTRVCRRGPTVFGGKRQDFATLLESAQESFVLRTAGRRGDGALVGDFMSPGAWRRAVKRAMDGKSVVVAQERVKIRHEVFPLSRADGTIAFEGCFVGIDALMRGGSFVGCAARISESPEVGARSRNAWSIDTVVVGDAQKQSRRNMGSRARDSKQ